MNPGDVSATGARADAQSPEGDWLASRFHAVYEQLAPAFGYKTRDDSAVPWADVPERNKRLMRAVAVIVEDDLRQRIADDIECAGQSEVEWLAAHRQDQLDSARIVGSEDAWKAAIRIARGES